MRVVGYQTASGVAIGRLEGETGVVPLGPADKFWANPAQSAAVDQGEQLDVRDLDIVPAVPAEARVLCVGLNYREHVDEGAFNKPSHPAIFGRWTRSLTVSGTPAPVPAGESGLDWEGELVAVVGRRCHDVSAEEALQAVFGYAVFNDLTARKAQHRTTQWTIGKNADHSGPLGDIVSADSVGDPADGLRVVTRVNGEIMQDGNTADMIFSVGEIISYVSKTMTLFPGDVIATGTPSGVGYTRKPARLLTPGDEVTVEIDRVGVIRTPIIASSATQPLVSVSTP